MTSFHELPDGAKLAYDDKGSGRDVLLIHGMCMTRRYYDRNFDALAERFRVVRVDLRSHGDSPHSEGGNSVAPVRARHEAFRRRARPRQAGGRGLVDGHPHDLGHDPPVRHRLDRRPRQRLAGPADLIKDDWPMGAFRMEDLLGLVAGAQADYRATMDHLIPVMMKDRRTRRTTPSCSTRCPRSAPTAARCAWSTSRCRTTAT